MRTVEPVLKLDHQAVGKGFGPHNGNNVVLERSCALQHDTNLKSMLGTSIKLRLLQSSSSS